MKKNTIKWYLIILITILIKSYLFPLSWKELKTWLELHPECVGNSFYFINEETNKEIDYDIDIADKAKWQYYDNKKQKEMFMPVGLREALINELKIAYDKIDECRELDKYRETSNKRKNETKYKLLFDPGLSFSEYAGADVGNFNPFTQTLTIILNADFVESYLGYWSSSHTGQLIMDDNIIIDKNKHHHVTLAQTLGHELLHLWLDKGGSQSGECTIWSLEKKCFDENIEIPEEYRCKCKEYTWNDCDKKTGDSDSSGLTFPIRRAEKPDDNFSYAAGSNSLSSLMGTFNTSPIPTIPTDQDFSIFKYYPDILVYNKFNYPDLPTLLDKYNGFSYIDDYVHDSFSNNHRVLIVPSGELMGDENSGIIKEALKRFVASGGTLLVLSQQYNTQIENLVPVPEAESLKSYGWSQDSSCYQGSVFFTDMHPVLSSATTGLLSAAVDGYFSAYPSNSTVLLKRKLNMEPAMLYYPYGNGYVILTSLYTDWGYTHSQATISEIKIFRDMVTFARNPLLPIPMYNLEESPTPTINLNAQVQNNTDLIASKAILKVYTPDRDKMLYELETSINLNQDESTQMPISFTLPELQTMNYGICHVDYELYNAENELIQLPTESDSGRFSIYKIITPVTIKDAVYMWVTVKDENVYWGQDAQFTIHFKNTRSESRTLEINNPFLVLFHFEGVILFFCSASMPRGPIPGPWDINSIP